MPNMSEKDPGLWAAVLAWLVLHQPQLFAAGLSVGGLNGLQDRLEIWGRARAVLT